MMNRRLFIVAWLFVGSVGLLATGCGGDGEEGVKVTGSVVRGGKAEEGVLVSFAPSNANEGNPKATRTGPDGKFELKVKPGKYTVVLTKMVDKKGNVPKDSENPAEDQAQLEASGYLRNAISAKYSDPTSSPLGVEIPADGKDLPPFDVAK